MTDQPPELEKYIDYVAHSQLLVATITSVQAREDWYKAKIKELQEQLDFTVDKIKMLEDDIEALKLIMSVNDNCRRD